MLSTCLGLAVPSVALLVLASFQAGTHVFMDMEMLFVGYQTWRGFNRH